MLKKIKQNSHIILLVIIWGFFVSPVFLYSRTPFPSTYQVNFFSPWSSYPGMGSPVKNGAQPDIIGQIYPWRYFSIQELKAGRIPLWNPYSFAGTPHLANYQSAPLFPLNLLFFLPIKFIDAWSALVLLQPLLAGIFTFALLRGFKVSKSGSLVSAISFMFCGFLVTWLGYATLGYAILPLPLAMLSVLKYVNSKKYRWLIILSLTFPLSYFAGHFQTSIYFTLGIISFIIYNAFLSKYRKQYLISLLFVLAGILLTMPQVIPSLELYNLSFRSELFQKIESIPLSYLATLFSPDFYGNPVTRNDWFGHYAEWNGYAGIIALSLSIFTILFNRNKKTVYFIILGCVALLLAFDTPLLSLLVALKIPVLSTSAASRIIVLFSFSIAVLAGFGFDKLQKSFQDKKRVLLWTLIVFVIYFVFSIFGFITINDSEKLLIAQKNSVLPIAILLSILGTSIVTLFLKHKWTLHIFIGVVILLSAFEMYRFATKWQNFDQKKLAYVDVPVVDFYNTRNHYDRAVGMSGGEDAVYYRMPILSGYDPLYKAEYGELIQFIGSGKLLKPERSVVNFPYKGTYTPQALNFLGVHYIVHKFSDGNFPWAFPFQSYPPSQFTKIYDDSYYMVFRNESAFDRAFVVFDAKKIKRAQIQEFMFQNDLRKVAALEEDLPYLDKNATGSATIKEYQPTNVKILANTSGRSLLILTDNYYPGWDVTVNGEKQKIYKVDYSFRGVILPEGQSVIEFKYRPISFYIGVYLFFGGALVIIVLLLLSRFSEYK